MRNPFEALKLFDVTMVSVAKAMMAERSGSVGDSVAALAVALSQLRKLKARETSMSEACRAVPELEEALKNRSTRTCKRCCRTLSTERQNRESGTECQKPGDVRHRLTARM